MARKKATFVPPIPDQGTTEPVGHYPVPKESARDVIERQMRQEMPVPAHKPSVTFVGTGIHCYKIDGKNLSARFDPLKGYRFTTANEKLIEALRNEGFAEV